MRSNVDEAPRPHGEGVSVQENPFLEVRDIVKNFGGVRASMASTWPSGREKCCAWPARMAAESPLSSKSSPECTRPMRDASSSTATPSPR